MGLSVEKYLAHSLFKNLSCLMQRRKYIASIFEALAAASSIATLLSFMFKIEFAFCCGLIMLVIIGLICYVYAEYQNWEKKSITLAINESTKLTIEEGDLFAKGDIILIPVNEYFDVHVGDRIVDPTSIHGIFINKIWNGNAKDLYDKHIKPELSKLPNSLVGTENRNQWYCNNDKYKLGTCIDITRDEKTYVLFALTHFNEKNHAYVSRTEFHDVLVELMKHVNDMCESKVVNMPLFGTGLSRLQSKPMQVLHYIVDCLRFECSGMDYIGGLHIKILSLDEMKVDLRYIDDIFKN